MLKSNIFPSTEHHGTCLSTPWGKDIPLLMNHCATVYEKKSAE